MLLLSIIMICVITSSFVIIVIVTDDLRTLKEERSLILLELFAIHSLTPDWTSDWPTASLAMSAAIFATR